VRFLFAVPPPGTLLISPTASPNRHEATAEIWQETYLSAVLRAILYSDDPTFFLEAYRRLEPISTPDAELRFLQGAEALFMKGSDSQHTIHRSRLTPGDYSG
jgi:hypothetical protein